MAGTVGRTAHTRTERGPDGTYATTFSERPLHWRDAQGEWRPFANDLRTLSSGSYAFESRGNGYAARFGREQDVALGRPVVRVAAGSASIEMALLGAKPSDLTAAGPRLTYKNAFPGTQISYLVDNERVKEDIVLSATPASAAAATYTFELALEGVTARKRADGSILFTDPSGESVFAMPAPFMTDANDAWSDDVAVTLEELGGGKLHLILAPSLAWLADPARAYPVAVDPSIETLALTSDNTTGQDVYITSDYPDSNFNHTTNLLVGRKDTGGEWQSLLQFPELDVLPQDSTIVNAQLRLYAAGGTDGLPVEMRANTGAWNDGTVTWNTAPRTGATVYSTRNVAVPGWTEFHASGLVRLWVQDQLNNFGVRLIAPNAANGQAVTLRGSNYTDDPSLRPQLVVEYVAATRLGEGHLWEYAEQDHGGGNSSAVNLSTGNVVFTHAGGGIAARGFSVDLTHTYNSQDPYGQTGYYDRAGAVYGEGWTFSQNIRLYEVGTGNAVVFKDPSGGADRVYAKNTIKDGVQQYHRPLYYDYTLTKDLSSTADPKRIFTLRPDSGGEVMSFDGGGKLRRIEDRNGNYLTYAYDTDAASVGDPGGRLATITDVAGRKTTFEYAGPGSPARLSRITDMAGRVSTYGYDGTGDLTTITHGAGTTGEVTTSLGYGMPGHLTSVTNPRGHRSYIRYATQHNWDTAGDAEGFRAEGRATGVAQSVEQAYRGGGSLRLDLADATPTSVSSAATYFSTPAVWNSVQQEMIAYVYVPTGSSLNARIALRDSRARMVYGPWWGAAGGRWTQIRMPDAHVDPGYRIAKAAVQFAPPEGAPNYTGPVWVDQLAARGVVDSLTDSGSSARTTARLGYDWSAKTTTVSVPDQSGTFRATTVMYDRFGQVVETTDPLGNTGSATYDADLRLTAETGPDNRTSRLSYYPNSNEVRTVTSPAGEVARTGVDLETGDVRYEIDPRNEELRLSGQPYVATVYVRDASGNPTSAQTNRYAADSTPSSVDLEADPFPAYEAQLRKTGYTYGTGGVLASMTDPRGNATHYTYDASGYLTRIDSPAGAGETSRRIVTITPNPDGSPASDLDAKGQKTAYEYDGLGRLTAIRYGMQDGTADFSTTYTPDAHGNATAMTDQTGSSSWAYDANDAVTAESRTQNGQTKTTRYAYFPNGHMKTLTTFAGQTVGFGYDALGRLVSQTDPNDGGRAVTYAYDALSRPTMVTFPSGVRRTVAYGALDEVDLLELRRGDGTLLQRFDYAYGLDPQTGAPGPEYRNGYVRGVTELDGSKVSYGYDDLGRLASAVRTGTDPYDQGYTYDPNDNRTSVSEGGNVATATYDAADQLTKQGGASYTYDRDGDLLSDGAASYTYDASGEMTGGRTADGRTLGFGYDGEGRRAYRSVGTGRTDYWYDQTGMGLETGATGATYLRHPGGTLLSRYAADVHNYMLDRLGNVTAITDGGGALAASYSYDPYGREIANSNAGVYNPYRYGGAYRDAATGLSQMGARYYDASTGRFTQQDPLPESVAEAQGYGYTPGNPVNFIDPSGLRYNNGTPYPRYGGGGGGSGGGLSSTKVTTPRRCNSFAADTEVATEDGPVEISEIEAGEEVLAYDERTGEVGSYEVADTITGRDAQVGYLTIGDERLVTTLNHPFYTEDRGWVEAGDLEVGDRVRRADGGYGSVQSLRVVREPQRMYNLTVAGAHTFFVGDGEWLVHNCGFVRITTAGRNHVRRYHFPGGAGAARRSVFNRYESIDRLAANASRVYPVRQSNGNYRRVVKANHLVGRDSNTGRMTRIYIVITNPRGDLVTMFPGRPR